MTLRKRIGALLFIVAVVAQMGLWPRVGWAQTEVTPIPEPGEPTSLPISPPVDQQQQPGCPTGPLQSVEMIVEPRDLPLEGGTITIIWRTPPGGCSLSGLKVRLIGGGLLETSNDGALSLKAVVPGGLAPGNYGVELAYESGAQFPFQPSDKRITIWPPQQAPVPTSLPPTVVPGQPVLTIRNARTEPDKVAIGQEFDVIIQVYNTGSRGAENTLITFPGGSFVPVGDNGHLLGLLHINATAEIRQRMRTPLNLESGTYKLDIAASANDFEGKNYPFPLSVNVEVMGAYPGRPQVVIEAARTEPNAIRPGQPFTLSVLVANRGTRAALNTLLTIASTDVAVSRQSGNATSIGLMGVHYTEWVTLPLVMTTGVITGRNNLEIAFDYSDWKGGTYNSRQTVGLESNVSLVGLPQVVLSGVRTEPPEIGPGGVFTLVLALSNVGGGDAARVIVALGGENGASLKPFAPLNAGNVSFIPNLASGETKVLELPLVVDGAAEAGAYNIAAVLAYEDNRDSRRTETQVISLVVLRKPQLRAVFYRPLDPAFVGQPVVLPIEVTNIGRKLVNVNVIEVSSPNMAVQNGSMYVGALDAGTNGTIDAMGIPSQAGPVEVVVTVNYLDDFSQPQVFTATLQVPVSDAPPTPAQPPPGAQGPGMEQPSGGDFWSGLLRVLRALLGLGS